MNDPNTIRIGCALMLDFRFDASGDCTLVTCSKLPLDSPDAIAAAFSETAFRNPAASEVWVNLLLSLEKQFDDWEESRPRPDRQPVNSGGISNDSRIVLVTRIETTAQFHRAFELLLDTARALCSALRSCGQEGRSDS